MALDIYFTDPPHCGCGFMSVERVYSLLSSTGTSKADTFNTRQLILFPSVKFTCAGLILKWTVAGRYVSFGGATEVNLWRRLENSSTVYEKVGSMVTALSMMPRRSDSVYEFIPSTDVVAQPGDIVGLLIPNRAFRPMYDENTNTLYYWSKIHDENVFDTEEMMSSYGSLLITMEICKLILYCTAHEMYFCGITVIVYNDLCHI